MMRKYTPPSLALVVLLLAGCAHNGTSTNSIVGTWRIAGDLPRPSEHQAALSGAAFDADGTGSWMYRYIGPSRRYETRLSKVTWTDMGNGKVRIVEGGTSQEFQEDVKGSQLVLTPPAGMFGTSGVVFERVK